MRKLVAVVCLIATIGTAHACEGCGCRGGPGYRAPNGKCVSWAELYRVCGRPATTRCTAEDPHDNDRARR